LNYETELKLRELLETRKTMTGRGGGRKKEGGAVEEGDRGTRN